ncbi:unnamed protein product [Rhizophagus irregularis]|uniref:T6SS Phospholipase effector Tle1-like catalytic domain-containing protein n=2 Tax=Rhizophagus irregularis TaxID=588596 RepID=A0A2I1EXH8_9GLOM|nr:hypothetical protein RhiirB3_528838 [Rhizophagus irregularis]CAB4397772.1 unnamed protein product [Rhizophagus irregularis]CAB4476659.1 unnamed protein product [Rhizophagus irregularis]CAB5201275.1 unnamed protein product [Rhizophagus irregularis]CAB5362047.1 unnamed protein product [Rhizophagus irregularis]
MGKNIVVLSDGTWNDPNSKSNVYMLHKELIERDYQQHVAYMDGIGIGELALNFVLDGAVAVSLGKKIKEGYKHIITHYNPGDDVWLFGFSRGAYTVRCISGMIRNCGILKIDRDTTPEQIDKRIDLAYEIYRDRDMAYHPEGSGSDDFKKSFCYPDSKKPIIKFLGLWDTVGAHGIPGYTIGEGFKYLEFYDQVVPNVVNFACQALAIHERVSFFEPCRILPNNSSKKVTVKETWFPGIHGEIGGGIKGNERISNATLLWVIENIVEVGGLLMRDDIESYRTRFSPDSGPSWDIRNQIFDRRSDLVPKSMLKDRVIPLELDPSQKFLRKDLLYRDGDWLLPFGTRSHLSTHYASNTYEELRKVIETKGIRLYNNVKYDKDENERDVRSQL